MRIRVDLAALRRGHVEGGEECEIDGAGPITVAEVRDLINDPETLVEAILTEGEDLIAIHRLDRYISPKLRAALETRDRTCVVPGCDKSERLEIDHVVLVSDDGPTSLDNLARLCKHHHALKTHKNWRLAAGRRELDVRTTDRRGRHGNHDPAPRPRSRPTRQRLHPLASPQTEARRPRAHLMPSLPNRRGPRRKRGPR